MHIGALVALAALAVALFAVMQSASSAASLTVSIGDSDNVVKAGTDHNISFQIKGGTADADYNVDYVTASSGVLLSGTTTNIDISTNVDAEGNHAAPVDTTVDLIIPNNAAGEYTITVRATNVASATDRVLGELTITVGDVGDGIASVEVNLGKVGHSDAKNAKNDTATTGEYGDSATATYDNCVDNNDGDGDVVTPESTCIAVTVSVKNSLGNAANAGDVNTIHVFAPLGVVLVNGTEGSTQGADARGVGTIAIGEDAVDATADAIGASTKFFVLKDEAGTIDVTAIVLGAGGSASSAALTLSFTGAADSIELGDVSGALAQTGTAFKAATDDADGDGTTDDPAPEVKSQGEATIEVTATDKSGNTASLTAQVNGVDADDATFTGDGETEGDISAANVTIEDADGNDVDGKIVATVTQKKDAAGDNVATAVVITLRGVGADPGTYTVKVAFGDNDPVTAEIVVAGDAKNVALSQEQAEGSSIVTVTATVTDADGNLVPDAGMVDFISAGSLAVTALDDDDNDSSNGSQRALDDGVASVRYVIIGDSGTATIIVSAGAGVDAVTTISVAAEEAEEEVEVVSLDCLSSNQGFSTYTCGVDSTASELFGLVSGRGATAIHLWNGSAWVRYAVANGAEVPGSSDFTVTEDDILYISN